MLGYSKQKQQWIPLTIFHKTELFKLFQYATSAKGKNLSSPHYQGIHEITPKLIIIIKGLLTLQLIRGMFKESVLFLISD